METRLESKKQFYTILKSSKILENLIVSRNLLFFLRKDWSFLLPVLSLTFTLVCVLASTWRILLCSKLCYRPKISIEDKVISVFNWKWNLLDI